MQNFDGACHCDTISYSFSIPSDVDTLPARACSCRFCQLHGGVYTSHARAELHLRAPREEDIRRYRFGHETADFILCAKCGVLICALCTMDDVDHAVLNINTLAQHNAIEFDYTVTNFDGETPQSRLARRRKNWTPSVEISIDA